MSFERPSHDPTMGEGGVRAGARDLAPPSCLIKKKIHLYIYIRILVKVEGI